MSVYTQLSQNQLSSILQDYGIADFIKAQAISDGIENSNYLIHTKSQDFVLTVFENLNAETLEPILEFMALGAAKGFAMPEPLRLNNGHFFKRLEDLQKPLVLCPRLPGRHPEAEDIDIALLQKLGEHFGRIHLLSLENEYLLELFPKEDLGFFFEHSVEHLSLDEEKRKLIHIYFEKFTNLNKAASELPSGICHCDFFPDNSLIDAQGFTGFLDWYDTKHSYFLLDIAVLAISWCVLDNTINQTLFSALMKGYQNIRALNEKEKLLLNDFIELSAFNFWLSRENYHAHMRVLKQTPNPKKPKETFFLLLKNLSV